MRLYNKIILALLLIITTNVLASEQEGNKKTTARPIGFNLGNEVQARIDFWKLIFTKYGENQLVFHHREHPEIIYSVLDLSNYLELYKGKEFEKYSALAIKEENERIREILLSIASGRDLTNPAERRLKALFDKLPGNLKKNIEEATNPEMLRYQRGIKERFEQGLIRSGRYLPEMEKIFKAEGLPIELTRLPLIESSFDYEAYSSVGAAGIWQFMRSTAKKMLRVDHVIDERRDPIASSRAAADYLSHAYEVLGAWPLAVTSYNHGINGVLKATKVVGSKDLNMIIKNYDGKNFGFATKNFYPEFMAALEIEQNIERYFPGLVKEKPVHYEEIRLASSIPYKQFVNLAGGIENIVVELNQHLMKPIISGRIKMPAFLRVKVPKEHVGNFKGNYHKSTDIASLEQEPKLKISSQGKSDKYYIIQMGDNLSKISKKLKLSIKLLQELNPGLKTSIKAGDKLILQ